ncbi:MAG: SRPBCC domain-containing protein [Paracoccaceae bacterium]
MSDLPIFVMEHSFDAPPAIVWRTWTEADLIERWYGPGVETAIHNFEVSPGGLWINEMRMGDQSMYQRMEYTEVEPPARLVMLMSNCDADWNIIDNPMMPQWPRTFLTEVEFEAEGEGTRLTLRWIPHEASDEQNEAFARAMEGMEQGWGAGMTMIAELLEELKD